VEQSYWDKKERSCWTIAKCVRRVSTCLLSKSPKIIVKNERGVVWKEHRIHVSARLGSKVRGGEGHTKVRKKRPGWRV